MYINKSMILLLILFTVPIFAFNQREANQWIGKNSNKLINAWGTPDLRINQRNGETIFIYRKVVTQTYTNTQGSPPIGVNVSNGGRPVIVTGVPPGNPMNMPANRPLTLNCVIQFRINSHDIIQSVVTKGPGC